MYSYAIDYTAIGDKGNAKSFAQPGVKKTIITPDEHYSRSAPATTPGEQNKSMLATPVENSAFSSMAEKKQDKCTAQDRQALKKVIAQLKTYNEMTQDVYSNATKMKNSINPRASAIRKLSRDLQKNQAFLNTEIDVDTLTLSKKCGVEIPSFQFMPVPSMVLDLALSK